MVDLNLVSCIEYSTLYPSRLTQSHRVPQVYNVHVLVVSGGGTVQVWECWRSRQWAGGNHLYPRLGHPSDPPGVPALAGQRAEGQSWVGALPLSKSLHTDLAASLPTTESESASLLQACWSSFQCKLLYVARRQHLRVSCADQLYTYQCEGPMLKGPVLPDTEAIIPWTDVYCKHA